MAILDTARNLGIWGFGAEGKAAFQYVCKNFPHLQLTILSDSQLSPTDTELIATAPRRVSVVAGDAVPKILDAGTLDVVIKSPGVSLYRPDVIAAKTRGVCFTSSTNLWFDQNPTAKTIVVTGTKGKSTTARLLHYILCRAGIDASLLGNVGVPALGGRPGREYTVLELSSYQVADLAFAPDIAILINLFPEHAPWHGGTQQYFADKLRILSIGERTRGICNFSDQRLRSALQKHRVTWFNVPDGYHMLNNTVYYRDNPVDCANFPLKGIHNLSNLAAACTAADMVGVHSCRQAIDLASFRQLGHRLEEFRIDGADLLCVDDSISTVPQSTIAALNTYSTYRTVLLLGGTDRGQDYSDLFDLLPATAVKCVVLLPPNGSRIENGMRGRSISIPIVLASCFEEGVKQALRWASPGELVLLSPAAPSFGEFRNFEERGNTFKLLCRKHTSLLDSFRPNQT